ncbi:MAG: hypothetical protein QOE93_2307 [Actinomycetota bacterium]|nr:hypothetical protein [Actinomycetota bacterium]
MRVAMVREGSHVVRRRLIAVTAVLVGAIGLLTTASPASAAPPFPDGARATALVGGAPLVQVVCPPAAVAGGTSTLGTVTVTSSGVQCTATAANNGGSATIGGVTISQFASQCTTTSGATNGVVRVPAGTSINGGAPVAAETAVTTTATVTFPGGTTAVVNEVVTTATSVTRRAIRITSGPASGTIIGEVVCGAAPYPLAVETAAADSGAGLTPVSSEGSSSLGLLVGGAFALVVVAQLAIARRVRRRPTA